MKIDGPPQSTCSDSDESGDDVPVAIQQHPLRVKPSGNAYTASSNSKDCSGFFARLPDELLMVLLESFDSDKLTQLGGTCKYLYAFTRSDELWRDLFVRSKPKDFSWHGTWRATYLGKPSSAFSRLDCSAVFSDVLHRPFFCAHTPLDHYARNIPRQNAIDRFSDLSEADFQSSWTNKPFILTDPIKQWPIYKTWNTASLLEKYASVTFRAEAVDWPLSTYTSYMHNSSDESPLYLFDRSFVEKMSLTVSSSPPSNCSSSTSTTSTDATEAAYWPPPAFGTDFFSVLHAQRPDRRWLILGPARSGSTFHKDPNATSAWNAVLTGAKYWLLFPSPPPGIILSPDNAEITAPLSIAEYLLTFHALARRSPGCVEAVCHAGEVLHVPSGWFHLVLNLQEGVAVTQNFVPRAKVPDVLAFLRDVPEQVTGFRDDVGDPFGLFVERLGAEYPDVLEEGMGVLERRGTGKKGRRTRWEVLTKGLLGGDDGEKKESGFSFGFGGGEGDESADEDDGAQGGFSFGFGTTGDDSEDDDDALPAQ
ncbi:Clavaminate synthase-like protein [Pseudovirgaria hyperparasitica]|uniref:Clavaminate synthase-like protein n=1 Tax=Pseudovirgaria hyperparasitica TaxID=470096 RepID=A0A6A6W481_9PEZI|nr:Clavaminate synthase-like protein [Pseudovirgaria hyperparasitica]KAF2756776.1 Clavaminate synthase-like protein [Pseudovirgaria hyperparasitica]